MKGAIQLDSTSVSFEQLEAIERYLDQIAKSYAIHLHQSRKIRDEIRAIRLHVQE